MITCYDYSFAKIISQSEIDCILVGDTSAMVMHGYATTVSATLDIIVQHTSAVARGAGTKFIISDMPFLTYRKGLLPAMKSVEKLIQAGAHAIKLEGIEGHEDIIRHIVNSGIPVMGHIGLTPQAVHQLGGFQVQGKTEQAAGILLKQAKSLEEVGCFAIVLECIPSALAQNITEQVNIPTIGIGAGPYVDGQVLVLQDLLGMDNQFKPKFLKTYLDGNALIKQALNKFSQEVKTIEFPGPEHCYVNE